MASSNSKSNYDVKDQDIEYLWWKYVEDDASYIASNVHWLEDNTICPVCGSSQVSFIFNKTSFNYLTCHDCTHVFFSKKVTDEGMNWYYAHGKALRHWNSTYESQKDYRSILSKKRAENFWSEVSEFIHDKHQPISILEIGAGIGDLPDLFPNYLSELCNP